MRAGSGVAVTGGRGYLGRQVLRSMATTGLRANLITGRCESLAPGSIAGRAVIHCAGRCRGAPMDAIWRDNVDATAGLLAAVHPETLVIHVSSRAVRMRDRADRYAASKIAAERLVSGADHPHFVVRLSVLTGPSGDDCGRSFLTRMVRDAVTTGMVFVSRRAGTVVEHLDVREAALTLAAVAGRGRVPAGIVEATTGPVPLDDVVEALRGITARLTGRTMLVEYADFADTIHPRPANPDAWRGLQSMLNLPPPTPLQATLHDTAVAVLAAEVPKCRD